MTGMRWGIIGGAVTVAIGAGIVFGVIQSGSKVERFHVGGEVRRLSGDHLKLKDGRIVEFAGLRLPYDDEPNSAESRETLTKWVAEEGVRLLFDDEKEDDKGRLQAYVYANDTSINERLLREGLAFAKLRRGHQKFRQEFLIAQNEARRERRGIWQTLEPATDGPFMLDEVGASFHRPDCVKVRDAQTAMIEIKGTSAAFDSGCAPCGKCRP
ncbi:MAG: thermonuclease family protein [Planctomycetes bacterium]|nr:thermonuclease family protein [Planctomycetota bacterium]